MNNKERIKFHAVNAIKTAVRYPDRAKLAAEAIVSDICDRKGLKSEWASIDQDIRYEIVNVWTTIIETIFDSDFDINKLIKPETNK